MTSSQEVHHETVEILADAVSELATRAIRPELQPFSQELSQLTGKLRAQVGRVAEPLSEITALLDGLAARMGTLERTVVTEVRRAHADQRSGTEAVVLELQEQLGATRRALRTARISLLLLVVVLVVVLAVGVDVIMRG
jgi:hypothetical protein